MIVGGTGLAVLIRSKNYSLYLTMILLLLSIYLDLRKLTRNKPFFHQDIK